MGFENFLKKQINKQVKVNCFDEICTLVEINEHDDYAVFRFIKVNDKTKEEKQEDVFVKLSEVTQLTEGEKLVNQITKSAGD